MGNCLRKAHVSYLSAIFVQRIKTLDRRDKVTSPILYSECMCGHVYIHAYIHTYIHTHSLSRGEERDPEFLICEISNRRGCGELITWELLVHL